MRAVPLIPFAVTCLLLLTSGHAPAQSGPKMSESTFSGLELRNIGPAVRSGRIADIVKVPTNPSTWYVAVASGNVWKTVNNGTTWKPIFEKHGSFSIGSLAIDPHNPSVVWLGTGPLIEVELGQLQDELESAGAPWIPGRKLPRWP
jgi:hypothetical protein